LLLPSFGNLHKHGLILVLGARGQAQAVLSELAVFFGVLHACLLRLVGKAPTTELVAGALVVVNGRDEQEPARRLNVSFGYGISGGIMAQSDKHREYAASCLRLAQNAPDEQSRSLYLMMAEARRALAEKAKTRDEAKQQT
jgi:hypothetical protein